MRDTDDGIDEEGWERAMAKPTKARTTIRVGRKIEKPCRDYARGAGSCTEEHCYKCGRHLDGDAKCPKECSDGYA